MEDIQNAINSLEVTLIRHGHKRFMEDIFSYKTIKESISALEKQIPKKVEIYDYGKAHCPVCKIDIHGIGKIKYCFHCGQKIDWD